MKHANLALNRISLSARRHNAPPQILSVIENPKTVLLKLVEKAIKPKISVLNKNLPSLNILV